eukprot:500734-Pyramimonas_sp.AAC.1
MVRWTCVKKPGACQVPKGVSEQHVTTTRLGASLHSQSLATRAAAVEKYLAMRSSVAVCGFPCSVTRGKPVAILKSSA